MRYKHLLKVALEKNVAPCFLSVCGVQDETKTVGVLIYWFNIEDPEHINYKSTVCTTVKVKG